MALIDDNGDPIQFGIEGFQLQSDGQTHMSGPCLGVVLSVQHSDDKENSWYELLSADQDSAKQASYIEASVLLIRGETHMNIVVDNCICMQGKVSNQGPTKDEPSDYSEDVPNGCSSKVLEDFYSDRRGFGIDNLDGDWVVVQFIGGVITQPIVTAYFPSPFNKRDSATKEQGRRYLLRRNNSELQIDKDGNVHLTHRVGQYIQMRDRKITLKHRDGQMLLLDDDGTVYLADKDGHTVTMHSDGITITNGSTVIDLAGEKILIDAVNDEVRVKGFRINMIGAEVNATAGGKAEALSKSSLADDFKGLMVLMDPFFTIFNTTLGTIAKITPFIILEPMVASLIPLTAYIKSMSGKDANSYKTKVLSGE